jgi:signal transduction histidine kinase
VTLSVRNTPPTRPADRDLAASGSGTGLAGLRRRVHSVDGTLRAVPTADGGYALDVTLPARGATTPWPEA